MARFFGSGSASSGAGVSFPAGSIIMFAGVGTPPPSGWLLCDGASLLRTTFPALFSAIGVLYGSVDGTHFTLPKFDDSRKPRGAVNDAGRGTTGGANSVTLTASESGVPAHTHDYTGAAQDAGSANDSFTATANNLTKTTLANVAANAAAAHENQSLFVDVNFIIHV